jgi:hypothetical protein
MFRLLHSTTLAASVALTATPLFAKAADTDRLVRSLQNSDDFRVRTQAALSLGGSKSKDAVKPLCAALGDENSTVRAAAAAALGRLHLGGDDCLESRRKTEKDASVKSTLKKAIDQLRAEPEPEFTSRTQYYVAVGKTTDNTGRGGDEVASLMGKSMRQAAEATDNILFAPVAETAAQAKKRLGSHKGVKGLFLLPRVDAPQYIDKSLKMRVEVTYSSYPTKNILGMMGIPLALQGIRSKSRDMENQLIEAAAERAIAKVPSFGANLP